MTMMATIVMSEQIMTIIKHKLAPVVCDSYTVFQSQPQVKLIKGKGHCFYNAP